MPIEENEIQLLKEEQSLLEELKALQDKHRHVKMVFENVSDNIKSLCKIEKEKKDDTVNMTQSLNLNESKIDSSNIQLNPDEELSRFYLEFLELTRKTVDSLIVGNSKEDFINIMSEKGIEPVQNEKTKVKVTNAPKNKASAVNEKVLTKDLAKQKYFDEEYDYSDPDIEKEDQEIKKENDDLILKFKQQVIFTNFRRNSSGRPLKSQKRIKNNI